MKPTLFFAALLAAVSLETYAQELGEFKPKDSSYGLNKVKDAKRILITGFEVNYQIYNEKQDYKQGGHVMGGGTRGDAAAEVSVGLEGLDEKTVQAITDQLFQDYIAKIKAKGLTIVTPEEAGKTETYKDFTKVAGGKVSLAEIPGVMNTTPSGFEYFVKGFNKDGKSKKGGFLGTETSLFPKLSKELDDAIIGTVDITVLFVRDKEAFAGNGAKVKIKTDLRIVSVEGVTMTSDAKVKMKGQNTVTTVTSNVSFYHGKMGAGATSSYVGSLAKDLEINGVVDEKAVTSAASGNTYGTSSLYGQFYTVEHKSATNAKVIPVDANKYKEGVYAAANKFLAYHTDEFLKKM